MNDISVPVMLLLMKITIYLAVGPLMPNSPIKTLTGIFLRPAAPPPAHSWSGLLAMGRYNLSISIISIKCLETKWKFKCYLMKVYLLRIEMLLELHCSISWFYSIELFPKGEDGDITGLRYLDVVALHNGTLRAAASLFIGPGILELDNPWWPGRWRWPGGRGWI